MIDDRLSDKAYLTEGSKVAVITQEGYNVTEVVETTHVHVNWDIMGVASVSQDGATGYTESGNIVYKVDEE